MGRQRIKENILEQERQAMREAEATSHRHEAELVDEEAVTAEGIEEGAGAEEHLPAEALAIHTDTETARAAEVGVAEAALRVLTGKKPKQKKSKSAAPFQEKSSAKRHSHGRRYLKAAALVGKNQRHPLLEAITLAQKTATVRFPEAIELHIHLGGKGKKVAERVAERGRGMVNFPHPVGKEPKVVIFDEKLIEQIARTRKVDFDIGLATPEIMPRLGKIAKILGPRGKMPNPKSGTVTNNPQEVIAAIRRGRVEYRADNQGNLHLVVGKSNWEKEKILDNCRAVLEKFPQDLLQSVTLGATMGPGIKVAIG